ncbi:helix-hairpin-helix domain-containing protein [Shigella flexneri]
MQWSKDCVNAVGVNLNTASVPLLTRVAGLTRMMAQNVVGLARWNGHSRTVSNC